MQNPFYAVYAVLGLAVLMIVHEAGHYFVARAFGMRVERFAIGIGPTIWKHQPRGSDTVFQVALIPFLAYVQIAGLNPFEDIDPDDKGSYANASLLGRISAIVAGPLANYLFASIVFFGALLAGGKPADGTVIEVTSSFSQKGEDGKVEETPTPAAAAGMESGDTIIAVNGTSVTKWNEIPKLVQPHGGKKLEVAIERAGQPLTLTVIPEEREGRGVIGITPETIPIPWTEAVMPAIETPAQIVRVSLFSIGRMIIGKEKAQLHGPLGLMRETEKAAKQGFGAYLFIVGLLSTSLAFFNMLPVPALDGGRLMFLGYEAVTRRRPNQKVEAQVHMVGMVMLLTTLLLVTYREWGSDKTPSEQAAEALRAEKKEKAKQEQKEKPGSKTSKPDAPQAK